MSIDTRVISIGALSANSLWGEKVAVRTGHATTTLIRTGKRTILVDPGLPEKVLAARLNERAGLLPKDITHVFLTAFKPDTSRGITLFDHATWWVNSVERESVGVPLVAALQKAAAEGDQELKTAFERDVAILRRCEPAPDRLGDNVDLFPLPGVTPGTAGVLVASSRQTLVVCGDAVPTIDHLEKGMVLESAADVTRARESFAEAVEIADVLVLGRDNLVANPVKRPF